MGTTVECRILFNFAASPVGGGLKRLFEYARWFDEHGGARFIVHPRCEYLRDEFRRNDYVVARQIAASRILQGVLAVREVERAHGSPDCYYAYGIPLDRRVGRVNWFHLSNVLPFAWRGIPLPLRTRLRFRVLGRQIRKGLAHADVISAESLSSLDLLGDAGRDRLFLSVNGCDDELREAKRADTQPRQPVAVVVGTYPYKAIGESCQVFDALKAADSRLTLVIFGDPRLVSADIRARPDVIIKGSRPRSEVIDELLGAKYYISTTLIENSSNAASEGAFLAAESYVSDIGPHRELLNGLKHERVVLTNSGRPLLHVMRTELTNLHLKTWAEVISEMNARIDRERHAAH
jgi:hypothetical protein